MKFLKPKQATLFRTLNVNVEILKISEIVRSHYNALGWELGWESSVATWQVRLGGGALRPGRLGTKRCS